MNLSYRKEIRQLPNISHYSVGYWERRIIKLEILLDKEEIGTVITSRKRYKNGKHVNPWHHISDWKIEIKVGNRNVVKLVPGEKGREEVLQIVKNMLA